MSTRRQFLKAAVQVVSFCGALSEGMMWACRRAWAETEKKILPRDASRLDLAYENPQHLDTRNLDIFPLKEFGTMGLKDHSVDIGTWRLEVSGDIGHPFSLSYDDLLRMPFIERNVLLVCPGVFANHGRWKGISVRELLARGRPTGSPVQATFSGPKGPYAQLQKFPAQDFEADRVFLAYAVNGETLPQAHGFPLRLVAEGYFGFDWIKYVDTVTVSRI